MVLTAPLWSWDWTFSLQTFVFYCWVILDDPLPLAMLFLRDQVLPVILLEDLNEIHFSLKFSSTRISSCSIPLLSSQQSINYWISAFQSYFSDLDQFWKLSICHIFCPCKISHSMLNYLICPKHCILHKFTHS